MNTGLFSTPGKPLSVYGGGIGGTGNHKDSEHEKRIPVKNNSSACRPLYFYDLFM
jgi:hypothetical protein